jgi:hypothetical protein
MVTGSRCIIRFRRSAIFEPVVRTKNQYNHIMRGGIRNRNIKVIAYKILPVSSEVRRPNAVYARAPNLLRRRTMIYISFACVRARVYMFLRERSHKKYLCSTILPRVGTGLKNNCLRASIQPDGDT